MRGEDLDQRSDIFNLGLILHELLSGKRAFHGDTSVETMAAILKQDPPDLPATIPARVRQIVTRCLEKLPANWFQSAKDLAFALGQSASSEIVPQPIPGGRPRGLPVQIAAALAIAVLAGVATHWLWREHPPAPLTGLLLADNGAWVRVSPDGHTLILSTSLATTRS